jgi:hypothetical protein
MARFTRLACGYCHAFSRLQLAICLMLAGPTPSAKLGTPRKPCAGARSRNRTGTLVLPKRRILSPLCLPISPPGRVFGGETRNRTGIGGFAIRCITILLSRRNLKLQLEMNEGKPECFPSELEREKSLELSTSTLARLRSTN